MANLTERIPIAPMTPADLARTLAMALAAKATETQAMQTFLSARSLVAKAQAHRSAAAYMVTRGEGLLWDELRLIARWLKENGGEANCRNEAEAAIARTLTDKGVLTPEDMCQAPTIAAHALAELRAIVDARPELLDP